MQSHTFASPTNQRSSQSLQKSVSASKQSKIQNIFPFPSKKIKTPDTQTNPTKTVKLNNDSGLQKRGTRTPAANMRLAQWGVKCKFESQGFYSTLVQVNSLVLLSPPLRQAQNR